MCLRKIYKIYKMGWRVDIDLISDEYRFKENYLSIFHRTAQENAFRYGCLYTFCFITIAALINIIDKLLLWFKPLHYKTSNLIRASSEESDQHGHPPYLIRRVFAVHLKKPGSLATHWAHSEDCHCVSANDNNDLLVIEVQDLKPGISESSQQDIQRIRKDTSAKKENQ